MCCFFFFGQNCCVCVFSFDCSRTVNSGEIISILSLMWPDKGLFFQTNCQAKFCHQNTSESLSRRLFDFGYRARELGSLPMLSAPVKEPGTGTLNPTTSRTLVETASSSLRKYEKGFRNKDCEFWPTPGRWGVAFCRTVVFHLCVLVGGGRKTHDSLKFLNKKSCKSWSL